MIDVLVSSLKMEWIKRQLTVIVIIANDNLLNLAIFAHFAPDILIKSIKVVLDLHRVHLILRVVCWVLVKVGQ